MRVPQFAVLIAALVLTAVPGVARASIPAAAAVVEFRVPVTATHAEYYRVRLTDPVDIETARRIKAGESPRRVPVGRIVRGVPDVNKGYTWHLDPERFQFAEYALSVCNVRPSQVESMTFLRDLCPWNAQISELWIVT